jgi:NadR type nicotinamide-nucleotide adenylyltransferase
VKHGIAVGKFYPPHAGHHYLIDTALKECDLVTVAVCYSSVENISVKDRIAWLRDTHGDEGIEYIAVKDDTPVLYTDETWDYFLEALTDALDDRYDPYAPDDLSYPNVIYSGEDYADEFAERLLKKYDLRVFREAFPTEIEVRQLDRSKMPEARATFFRSDPSMTWDLLAPATKAGLAKRVVVCGAESSGTTTLSKALAGGYDTAWVPEYGRTFDEAVGPNHQWTEDDFWHIATEQRRLENNLARRSRHGLLICDTDEYATAMFSEFYLASPKIGKRLEALAATTPADLYIITDHEGVDFDDDGTRRNEEGRAYMTSWMKLKLPINRIVVTGSHEQRMRQATAAINEILHWDIATPIEYRDAATA